MAGFQQAGAIEGVIARSLALPIMAILDLRMLDLLSAQAITNGVGLKAANTPGYIINADFSTGRTEDNFKTTYYDTSDMSAGLRGTVDKTVIGVNKPEVMTVGNLHYKSRILGFTKAGSMGSSDLKTGALAMADGNMLHDHGFIGKDYTTATGSKFPYHKSLRTSVNLSQVELLVFHTEAIMLA